MGSELAGSVLVCGGGWRTGKEGSGVPADAFLAMMDSPVANAVCRQVNRFEIICFSQQGYVMS